MRELDRRTWWSIVTFLVLFLLALALMWLMLRPFVPVLGLALIISVVLGPVHERIVRLLGDRRSLATMLSVVGTVLLVVAPATYLGWRVAQQAGPLVESVREWLGPGGLAGLAQGRLPPRLRESLAAFPIERLDARLAVTLEGLSRRITHALAEVPAIGAQVFTGTFVFLSALYAFYYGGAKLGASVAQALPMDEHITRHLMGGIAQGVRSLITAKFLTAVIQGFVGYVGFRIIDLPFAVALSVIMAFCSFVLSLIPLLGTGLVWVPAAVILFFTGRPWAAIFLLAWGFLVIGIVDNFVNPLFAKGALRIPGSVVIVTLFGGIAAFGPLGALFGPLIGSLIGAFLRIWCNEILPVLIERPPPSK